VGYVFYQYFSFLASPLFEDWGTSFAGFLLRAVASYLKDNTGLIIPGLIALIVCAAAYYVLPVLCQAALIQIIARKRNGQEVRIRHGIRYGLLSFLPLLEYRLLLGTFSVTSAFSIVGISARTFGWESFNVLLPIFGVAVIIGFILTLFFTYTEFFIVIDDKKVFESISKSSVLVVTHLEQTIFLTILMVIIGVRIIVQILFVFLIPGLITFIIYGFTAINLPDVAAIIGTTVGILGLLLASYLNGVIHVFAMSVWTFTFLELTHEELPTARSKPGEEELIIDEDEGKSID